MILWILVYEQSYEASANHAGRFICILGPSVLSASRGYVLSSPTAREDNVSLKRYVLGEVAHLEPNKSDISDLNSSRHSLVYNHHQQLFEAGDTIAHLNRRTPQLLGILIELQQTFSDIERLADSVSVPPSQAQKQSRAEAQRIAQLPDTLGLMLDAGG